MAAMDISGKLVDKHLQACQPAPLSADLEQGTQLHLHAI